MFRTALLILSGNAAASALTLLRNLAVARLISVENYGIASTFAVSMAIVEMMSGLGLQQQIIQAKDGNDAKLQAGLQGFQLLRGIISGAVLFMLAGPISDFLNVPQAMWAFQLMALVPVMNAAVHFDVYRLNRAMNYTPWIVSQTVPALVSLAMIWPLYTYVAQDYRVMLYALLTHSFLMAATAHVVAERAFRVTLTREIMGRGLAFGWPLLINNVLLFAVFNGEKLVVGRELGMAALGIFSMGFTLTLAPTLVMAKSVQSFFLPQLSATQGDAAKFAPLAMTTLQAALLNGCLLVAVIVAVGGPFVQAVLGEKYAALLPLLVWLAILQALRVFKAGGAVVALSCGKTGNAAWANIPRVISLGLSWWAAAQGWGLIWVIWISMAGEALGVVTSFLLVRRRLALSLAPMTAPLLAVAAFLALAGLFAIWPQIAQAPRWPAGLAVVAGFGVLLWTMRDARRYLTARVLTKFQD